tara:strand:- start:21145 stop:21507 length:363 start_codon:yes stop_codon:yes gene_type:complete
MEKVRNITRLQKKYMSEYIKKSEDDLFLKPINCEISEWDDLGWIEYRKYDNVLWIYTAYAIPGKHKEVLKVWNNLKELAKNNGCDRIQFATSRNPKAFNKLIGAKVKDSEDNEYKMEVLL